MKVNVVKLVISVFIALLMGLICYEIAQADDHRNWISFGVTTVSLAVFLILAMGINYNKGSRTVNIKLASWVGFVVTLIANVIFSCCNYNVVIYIATVGLLTLLLFTISYSLIPKDNN